MSTHCSVTLTIVAFSALSACTALTPKQSAVTQAEPVATDTKLDPAADREPEVPQAVPALPRAATSAGERLQQLIQQRAVTELRTVYNGSYGASLLFDARSLEYYAALFHNKDFWKISKTKDQKRAELLYSGYAKKSSELAEADLKRIRLQADYAHTEARLSERASELSELQSDLEAQRQQGRAIAAQQAIARQEAARLSKQQTDAEKQLRELQDAIRKLEAQRTELGRSFAH